MKGISIKVDKLQSPPKVQIRQLLGWVILTLLSLNITACNSLLKPSWSEAPAIPADSCMAEQHEIERLKNERERLQKLLAEKEAQLRTQQVQQQDQAKTLQETASQAVNTQVKLRRLATRPAAASAIAESEVAMENLKSSPFADAEQVVQTQAQRLLNAAAAAYAEDNFIAAMDYAAHARGLIDMIKNNRTFKMAEPRRLVTPFEVPIPLRAAVNCNLRQKPGRQAAILGMLKKDSAMTAEAYQGDWLQVQTVDGLSGWVLNALVEAQVGER